MNTPSVVNMEDKAKKAFFPKHKISMLARYLVHKQLNKLHTGCLKIVEGGIETSFGEVDAKICASLII